MIVNNLKIYLQTSPMFDGIGLYGIEESEKYRAIAEPLVLRTILKGTEEEGFSHSPFVNISNASAQHLLNQLWNLGFRPSDGVASTGQLESLKNHLEDMRLIVGDKLKIDLNKGRVK